MYGDIHVARRVALGLFPYTHFGVEMPGGGICENSPPGVRVVTYADFARGGPTGLRNPDASPAERAQTVERAASRVGERRYSLSGNNCEHFANWCATGVAISHQVLTVTQQAIAFLGALLRAAFVAACSLLVVSAARAALAE
jgi:Lecithin retinol acyltransferase